MLEDLAQMEQPAATHEAMNGRKNGIPTDHEYELGGDGRVELLKDISVGAQSIAAYTSAMGEEKIEELRSLAADMRDARVLHVNSTAYGGGVAELLRSHIPLLRSLGVDAHWVTIRGDESFFNVTKGFHNALPGRGISSGRRGQRGIPVK